ncbi:hypothetical protein [Megasphaera elsdenii]|uniref:hypothetical protein n=1 Tax=Megasphaera elsdenii TaxID=907 RepID=UPI0035C702A3
MDDLIDSRQVIKLREMLDSPVLCFVDRETAVINEGRRVFLPHFPLHQPHQLDFLFQALLASFIRCFC